MKNDESRSGSLGSHPCLREFQDLGHIGGSQAVLTFGLDVNLTLLYRKTPSVFAFFCLNDY